MDFLFWFGWLGPILVVVSLAVPNVMWFRVLNLIGSTIAAMTSVIDSNWPFVFMNGSIALINVFWIWKITRPHPAPAEALLPEHVADTVGGMEANTNPGLVLNETIRTQLDHRTIRAFTDQPVSEDEVATLLDVARHAPTTSFYQACTVLRIKDPAIREVIHQSSRQPYVGGDLGELFVFVVDLSRLARIRESADLSLAPLETVGTYTQGVEDTLIAAQNMVVAAESLGLGTCYLGSIGRDPLSLIEALQLPKFTYPLVGMLVGHPNQEPQKKPRIPRNVTTGVDTYPDWEHPSYLAAMEEYDQTIQGYYDLREGGKRQDSYTLQAQTKPGTGPTEKTDMLAVLRSQGMCLR